MLKGRGYGTAIYGKWHLGHHPEFLPTRHGFDDYFGLPYSNDMWRFHPAPKVQYPALPLIEGERIIATDPDQTRLTTQYTERAVQFIEQNRERPFFLYVAHNMPHVPLFVSDMFKGKTARGLYGDVIAELDWSVGRILDALKRTGLDEQTLVIFTSDNGPWLDYGDHGGSAGRLRAGKETVFEGGVRVPFIARMPRRIPAGGVNKAPAMTIDLLPTLACLAGAEVPREPRIDGRDIWHVISGERNARSPHEVLYFYWMNELHALRAGRWKLHLPHPYKEVIESGSGGKPGRAQQSEMKLALYDLERDAGETTNVAALHPEIVRNLMELAERAREDLGDSLTKREGRNVRQPGRHR
jgi:arylsulfatase A-like enzyme